jgi:hypothetical protein
MEAKQAFRASTGDDSLIISDLDNQLGVLGWHTDFRHCLSSFDSCVCPDSHGAEIFYWILLIDPSKSAAV